MSHYITTHKSIAIHIKREDLLHPIISGNKFRKLKYNLLLARELNCNCLVTFGGAFSNHILATAASAKENGFESIGIIRGEELKSNFHDNPTLTKAEKLGMKLIFVSRDLYRDKVQILKSLGLENSENYILPEGGTNLPAITGCEEILSTHDKLFDYVCCSVGTGGTISGIINSSNDNQQIIGFSSLKGDFLIDEIRNFVTKSNWSLKTEYHFGGYGKVTDNLIQFINDFKKEFHIPLDPIYTGKMVYGVMDLIDKSFFEPNSSVLLIHTGGLQGIEGMNYRLQKQNRKTITI